MIQGRKDTFHINETHNKTKTFFNYYYYERQDLVFITLLQDNIIKYKYFDSVLHNII